MAGFISTGKGRRSKRGTKEQENTFQKKEENENILFNFYMQILVLVITEMQIMLFK